MPLLPRWAFMAWSRMNFDLVETAPSALMQFKVASRKCADDILIQHLSLRLFTFLLAVNNVSFRKLPYLIFSQLWTREIIFALLCVQSFNVVATKLSAVDTDMTNQQMHISKYVHSRIMILHQHVSPLLWSSWGCLIRRTRSVYMRLCITVNVHLLLYHIRGARWRSG